jgi:hypothetical protein
LFQSKSSRDAPAIENGFDKSAITFRRPKKKTRPSAGFRILGRENALTLMKGIFVAPKRHR